MGRNGRWLAAMALFTVTACGGPKSFDLAPASTKDTIQSAPAWFLEPPAQEDQLTAAATATSRDLQIAIDKARVQAQVDVAQQLSTRMMNLTSRFQEETGLARESNLLSQFSSATKAVTDETLAGVRTQRTTARAEGNVYRAYVLVELPLGRANELLLGRLQGQQEMYTRFRATEAYAELDDELQRYEQWRQTQR